MLMGTEINIGICNTLQILYVVINTMSMDFEKQLLLKYLKFVPVSIYLTDVLYLNLTS